MCGIAGIIAEDPGRVREALTRMVRALVHRGPDDEGLEIVDLGPRHLGLGMRRLSIIDVSPAGHQPMVHPETGDVLIYNGELYNYLEVRDRLLGEITVEFRGHSDSEVILHAFAHWGPRCLGWFEGMFAIAFFDRRKRSLILARDPVGIKPLYVATGPGWLLFASELRSLMEAGLRSREVDERAMAGLLAYGAVQDPLTMFRGVRALPAGHVAEIELDFDGEPDVQPRRHWYYPGVGEHLNGELTESTAAELVERTLDRSVKNHLMSDVPVGIFLSSGLDSTIVAGLATRHASHVRTFTVGFADEPDMSESPLARETADAFGVDHTDIQITGRDAEAATVAWMESIDQPSMDGLNSYVLSQAVRAEGITVALSGLGGDELLGGYPSFQDVPRFLRALRRLRPVPAALRGRLFELAAFRRGRSVRSKARDVGRSDGSIVGLALRRRRQMPDDALRALGLDADDLGLDPSFQPPEALSEVDASRDAEDVVAAVSRYEARYYMGNMLLRDGDLTGMAHSLEIRVPILDRRMLDLCFALPGPVRLPNGVANKHLLRAAFAPMLREALLVQRKRGFELPIRRWMRGPLRNLCEENLDTVKAHGVLRPAGVDGIWGSFLAEPETPVWTWAFILCVLGGYLRRAGAT